MHAVAVPDHNRNKIRQRGQQQAGKAERILLRIDHHGKPFCPSLQGQLTRDETANTVNGKRKVRIFFLECRNIADKDNVVQRKGPVQSPDPSPRKTLEIILQRHDTRRGPFIGGADRIVIPLLKNQKPLRLQILGDALDDLLDSPVGIFLRHTNRDGLVRPCLLVYQLVVLRQCVHVFTQMKRYRESQRAALPGDQKGTDQEIFLCPSAQMRGCIDTIPPQHQIRTISAGCIFSFQYLVAILPCERLLRTDFRVPARDLIEIKQLIGLRIAHHNALRHSIQGIPTEDNMVSRGKMLPGNQLSCFGEAAV